MKASVVPLIDIAPFLVATEAGKRAVAREVGRACEEIGFLTVVGHDVPGELVEAMYGQGRAFFDLPLAEKLQVRRPSKSVSRGYIPIGDESLSYSLGQEAPPDVKEVFAIGRDGVPEDDYHRRGPAALHFAPNLWPARPIGLCETAIAYFRTMERLASDLMRIFAVALALPEDFFADKIDRHTSTIRLINYPDQEREPVAGQLRSGVHSDYGSLTILKIEDAPGGLQVRARDGQWVDVAAVPGAFIVNIGDLMMHWTNDRWISTLHRVVNPPRDRALGSRRLSIVFFHQPNYDAVIECLPTCQGPGNPPKHPPVTSGEHRLRKFLATSLEPEPTEPRSLA
jgi:isopenicillin N synthase-like dioxygenase